MRRIETVVVEEPVRVEPTACGSVQVDGKANLTIRRYVVPNTPPPTLNANDNGGFFVQGSSAVTIRGLHVTNASVGVYSNSPRTTVQDSLFDAAIDRVNVGVEFDAGASQGRILRNTGARIFCVLFVISR